MGTSSPPNTMARSAVIQSRAKSKLSETAKAILVIGKPSAKRKRNRSLPRNSFLRGRVGQIIEIDALAIAIVVRSDKAKTVEVRSVRFVARVQFQPRDVAVQRDSDLSAAVHHARIVLKAPHVRAAIRVEVRPAIHGFFRSAVDAVNGREEETFPTRPADPHSKKIGRRVECIRPAAVEAVLRVEKTDQGIAV